MKLTELFGDIANAIREKDGSAEPIQATKFPERIRGLTGGGGGENGWAIVPPVKVRATVEVFEEVRTTYMLYNGVKLPNLPFPEYKQYPYVWIRKNNTTGYYDVIFSKLQPWYDASAPGVRYGTSTGDCTYYQVPIASGDAETAWTFKATTNTWFGVDANRTVLWSNHDIPNGSATATDIYFEGTEPVPVD